MLKDLYARMAICAAIAVTATSPAAAQTVEEFYTGKTITLVVGFPPGNTPADFATYISEHMPQYIPGKPNIVVEFMPGGGGLRAANHFYNAMPRDGTSLHVPDQSIAVSQYLAPEGVQYDASKIEWIGIAVPSWLTLMVRKDAGIESVDDLKEKEIFVGSSGVGSETDFFPRMTNGLLGTKMNVIPGFPGGTTEVMLALETGEIHGTLSAYPNFQRRPDLLAQLNPIFVYGNGREPRLPDVPNVLEAIEGEEDKRIVRFLSESIGVIGRSIATTPDVPADRVQALRVSFDELMKDPAFLKKLEARGIAVTTPIQGEEATKIIRESLVASPAAIKRAQELIAVE